jgi:hypothetical protein
VAGGAGGGRARAHSAVKVRYGFPCTYYGTTATGKKCTVSRFGCEVHLRDPCVPCVPCVSRLPLKFLKRRRDEPAAAASDTEKEDCRPAPQAGEVPPGYPTSKSPYPHGTIKVVVAKVIRVVFLSQVGQ